jgi:hypothetical protein
MKARYRMMEATFSNRQKIQEFSAGKALSVTKKLFALVSKKTGEQYDVLPFAWPYKNAWGAYTSYWVYGSRKSILRANFSTKGTDEIVSIDMFTVQKGVDHPVLTLSLEGFGISKVYYDIIEFIKGGVSQGITTFGEAVLHEGWKDALPAFFSDAARLAATVSAIKSNDTKALVSLHQDFIKWIVSNGGFGIKPEVYNKFQEFKFYIKKYGKQSSDNPQAAKAFDQVPVTTTLVPPPSLVDPNKFDTARFTAIADDINKDPNSPFVVLDLYKTNLEVFLSGKGNERFLVAYGDGGVGKSYSWRKMFSEKGMVPDVNYKLFGKYNSASANQTALMLVEANPLDIGVFEECDVLLKSKEAIAVLKQACDPSNPEIAGGPSGVMNSAKEEVIPANSSIPATARYLFITNIPRESMGDAAFLTRGPAIEFKFSDAQVLEYLRTIAGSIFADQLGIDDPKEQDFVFNLMLFAYEKFQGDVKTRVTPRLLFLVGSQYQLSKVFKWNDAMLMRQIRLRLV